MKVTLIASTTFNKTSASLTTGEQWVAEDDHASDLSEFAGRACYQSWTKPNPATATNEGYLGNILMMRHYSVLEHGSATFYIEDVSRSLTHELVRHRHLSYSQLSQRFVTVRPTSHVTNAVPGTVPLPYITPPLLEDSGEANAILSAAWDYATHAYERLMAIGEGLIAGQPDARKKRAKEAARAVLPNMTPTAIVVTGNHRAWREFLAKRATLEADAEIRRLAMAIYQHLYVEEPNLYQDFTVMQEGTPREYLSLED